ncbi:hypothetical protein H7I77_13025 [Mycolicibacterium novocastrense]|uniref:Uncharacterized protein n=1 Tax=Mycolicibacterium novocastrense TaxID=59813 RepID=A0AAW5SMD9_MYCNV|nr:hypothetical protein [Mycolicibacterium novocastrense]MCV7024262.1 hypothetical protein [Mycolicibacterium novocastrense]GAT09884.1 uncharacterized protein RMCN_3017 [Mycolicibacterium novocastrense]
MSISLADIQFWEPDEIHEVSQAAAARARTSREKADELRNLPAFTQWSGDAAEAAREAISESRNSLEISAREAFLVAVGAARAYDDAKAVKSEVRELLAYAAESPAIEIVTNTNTVLPPDTVGWSTEEVVKANAKVADLRNRIAAVLMHAESTDDELARVLSSATGDRFPSIGAENVTPERELNRRNAFREVYGRDPASPNDWRMAAALDPGSYQPRNLGVDAEVVAGSFTPQPGRGLVRTNLFIPAEKVQNVAMDGTDIANGRLFPDNLGDNRGPDPNADIEASRVTILLDYENGVVVARQNPTVAVDGERGGALAAVPQVNVLEAPDGRITIDYNAHDSYENPAAKAAGVTVNGRVTFAPAENGAVSLGGNTTIYPSMETYQYRDYAEPVELQWDPANSGSELGPATSLSRHHWVGDATIPFVEPDIPSWKWELENLTPWGGDPFSAHATELQDPTAGRLPTVAKGR